MTSQAINHDTVRHSRHVEQLGTGQAASDGAGVKLTRLVSQSLQQRLDPFLMLDAFKTSDSQDYIAGFPDHPHRGFETLTYLLSGRLRHHDNAGHQGLLEAGGIQWMTAGSGIIHSEMPEQENGLMEGFQLWINLPAKDKMIPADYRDVQNPQIPEFVTPEGVKVRVIAGSSHGVQGAIQRPASEPLFLDVHIPPGVRFSQSLPERHNAFFYVYRGAVTVHDKVVPAQYLAILSNAEADGVTFQAAEASRLILVAGQPLHEPIVQHGPFVMNTQQQIQETLADYQNGRPPFTRQAGN